MVRCTVDLYSTVVAIFFIILKHRNHEHLDSIHHSRRRILSIASASLIGTTMHRWQRRSLPKQSLRPIDYQFQYRAIPLTITPFNSDFVIQFATPHERDLVASSQILHASTFSMLLVCWNNQHGGKISDWNTPVTIDITGFPPHAFDKLTLDPLL